MIAGEEGDANPASRTSSPQAHWGQGIAVALCFAILQLLVAIPPALPCPALPDTRVLEVPFPREPAHRRKTEGEKQSAPGLRPTTPWPPHAMEEAAEKEEKTQQHAVAMVLEQSEGEGRGQDPATL